MLRSFSRCLFVGNLAMVGTLAMVLGGEVNGGKPDGEPPPLRGEIKHRAVAEFPLPRDRTVFGIGEEVDYWIDPPDADGPDAVIGWQVEGTATVYPVIGPATMVTVGMMGADSRFTVSAARRDPGRITAAQKPAAVGDSAVADFQSWLREQLAALPKGERAPASGDPPAEPEYPKELRAELRRLDGLRQGRQTPLAEVDELGRKLLETYTGAKERGQIYYQLAHVHAQSGLAHPERVIAYARKALEHPLEPLQVPRMYVYWGDAVHVTRAKEPLVARRKWSAVIYLAGLREMLRFPLPGKAPEVPVMARGLGRDADPRSAEGTRRRLAEIAAARRKAEFQGAMIQHRNILTGQIAALYHRHPVAPEEMRALAEGVLRDPRSLDRFLRAVKGARWEE